MVVTNYFAGPIASKTTAPGPAPDGGPAGLTLVPATTIIEPDECPAGTEGAFVVVTFRIIGQGVCAPTMPASPLFRRLRTRLHCCSRRMPPLLDHAAQRGDQSSCEFQYIVHFPPSRGGDVIHECYACRPCTELRIPFDICRWLGAHRRCSQPSRSHSQAHTAWWAMRPQSSCFLLYQ